MSVHIMARGRLGAAGKPLRISIAVTDQFGEVYKIKNLSVSSGNEPHPPRSFRQRLGDAWSRLLRDHNFKSPLPVMPWTFDAGAEHIEIAQSVLQKERRSYAAHGRQVGGLGSLNVGLQSEPNSGWTKEGQIPELLWSRGKATPIASPNLNRLIKVHTAISQSDKENLERYLLSQLTKDSQFADVSYFAFIALHRMGRTVDALLTATTFLVGDQVDGYSNLLGTLSAVISHEHFEIDPQLYPAILKSLDDDEKNDFKLRQKINVARLEYVDREGVSGESS